MRVQKILSLLSTTPIPRCSQCRYATFFAQKSVRPPALPAHSHSTRSLKCLYSTSTPLQPSPAPAPKSTFSYRVGASFSAKGCRFNPKEDLFTFNPERRVTSENDIYTGRPKSGQDAFFVSNADNGNSVAFGVADGVGGWSDSGIDSAHFSHGLCKWMASIASEESRSEKNLAPRELLQSAYNSIVEDGKVVGGGSTACIAVGNENGTLRVSNLGDSGYIQLRLNAVHHFSNPQTHAFNTPYQLSIVPPRILALSRLFGGEQLSDSPHDSDSATHQVRHGDVLIFATDGVWDNLTQLELLKIVSRQMIGFHAWLRRENGITVSDDLFDLTREGAIAKQHENTLQTLLAVNIVGEAKAASLNSKRDGPFAKEVQKHYPDENYRGGKVDDICVVVAIVIKKGKGDG